MPHSVSLSVCNRRWRIPRKAPSPTAIAHKKGAKAPCLSDLSLLAQQGGQEARRVRLLATAHLLRRAGHQDAATTGAPFRPQIDDPVGGFDDVQVVLNDDYGVAPIPQLVQHLEQLLDVVEVQARGRLVQDVEGLAGVAFGELPRQLDPLRLAPDRVVADWPSRM